MSRDLQRDRRNVFTLVEEATHLLRRAPLSAWLAYYAGSAPFVVFLFYFWSDMSRSPSARHHLLESSLLLALCYVWMKVWQSLFSGQLLAMVEGRERIGKLPLRGWIRLLSSQVMVHSTMPFILPLAVIAVVPAAWAYSFYHNVTILAPGHFRDRGRTRPLLARALQQAHYAPVENHYMMLLMLIFAIMVYMNLFVAFILGTSLMKSITGMENAFSMSPMLYFSSALQAMLISVSYLVVNPFVKALYILRCFYGAARKSGADIDVSLRALSPAKTSLLAAMLCLYCAIPQLQAQEAAPHGSVPVEQVGPGSLPPQELGQSIRDVLQGSEFQWRLPRESEAMEESWLSAMLRSIGKWIDESLDSLGKMIGWLLDWFFGGGDGEGSSGSSESAWIAAMPKLVIALAVILVAALAWLIWKNFRQSRQTMIAEAAAVPPEVNLENENVLASQLPENEWLRMAREKMESGDLRLALRALFLATLAHLGEKRLLHISRSKSNGDYVRELGWRARGRDELSQSFSTQVRTFDRVWYGWHEVTRDLMESFQQQHERITSHAS